MLKDKLDIHGINLRNTNPGNHKTVCPECSHTRKSKTDPCLSVAIGPISLSNGTTVESGDAVWSCHNCGWAGTTVQVKRKEYNMPYSELKNLDEPVIKWFGDRGISNQTLLRYKVTQSIEYMPQTEKESRCINYNYFIKGKLINIKFRDGEKNFKLVSGAQLCFYGLDVAIENSDTEIAILEGENDVLACYEAGIKYAVSVPNGASKGTQKLDWLDEMMPFLEGKKVYLGVDMDEAGDSLREELARRIGKENCWNVYWPEKDANDTLKEIGPTAVKDAFSRATPFPIDGIEVIDHNQLINLYENGNPVGCKTGWENTDEHIQIHAGMVYLITGIPGHGKSTWLKNLLVRLTNRYEWKHLIYSAEEASATYAATDLMSIRSGKTFFKEQLAPRLTREEVEYHSTWVDSNFFYYKLEENESTVESIMEKGRQLVKSQGIRSIVIDNMSTVERGLSTSDSNRHNQIGNMMRDLRVFARKNGVAIFLVAHPKKMIKDKSGEYEVPDGYSVGDSSHYYNSPDVGITVYRRRSTQQTEIHWWKVRFKWIGQLGVDHFKFDIPTNRYMQTERLNNGENKEKFIGQPDPSRFVPVANARPVDQNKFRGQP
jgi:twinkle protein